MYSNAAGIIPVVEALLGKGAALGTVLAFMMAVIALSLPEMIILRKVLRPKLIATFAGVVASRDPAGRLAVQRGAVRRAAMKIQVLGTGCAKCKQLTANAEKAVAALGCARPRWTRAHLAGPGERSSTRACKDLDQESGHGDLGKAKRVRIYVNEDDKVGGKPLHYAILELLRGENAQGATVLRAVEGFGAGGVIRVSHLVDVAASLPVVIEWIDRPEQVERLVPRLRELVRHGLITVDDTDVLLYEPAPVRDLTPGASVRDVMRRDVAAVRRATPIREVVELMLGKVYRAVPVVEDGRPVGIVTNGDLVHSGGLGVRVDLLPGLDEPELHDVLERLSTQGRTAGDVMTPAPITVQESARLTEAAETMARRRLKRLPVVSASGALVGIVSRVDLLRAAAGGGGKEPVARRDGAVGRSAALACDAPGRPDGPPGVAAPGGLPGGDLDAPQPRPRGRRRPQAGRARHRRGAARARDAGPAPRRAALARAAAAVRPREGRGDARRPDPRAEGRGRDEPRARDGARGHAALRAIATMLRGDQKVLAVTDGDGRLVGMVDRADLLHGLMPARG